MKRKAVHLFNTLLFITMCFCFLVACGQAYKDNQSASSMSIQSESSWFPPHIYTLSYEAGEGGSITGEREQTVQSGEDGTLVKAVPDYGYVFLEWSDGLPLQTRQDTCVQENLAFTAYFRFVLDIYTVEYQTTTGGSVQGEIEQSIIEGMDGTEVTATPYEGYKFVGWSDGVKEATRLEKEVQDNITVRAIFEKIPTFTVSYGDQAYISGRAEQTVFIGENTEVVRVIVPESYQFMGWSDGYASTERTDENIQENISVYPILKRFYTFTYLFDITTSGNYPDTSGEWLTFTTETNTQKVLDGEYGYPVRVIERDGFEFTGWSDGYTGKERTDLAQGADITVTAYFVQNFAVNCYATAGGSITTDGDKKTDEIKQTVRFGEYSKPVYAIPDEGYHFVGWRFFDSYYDTYENSLERGFTDRWANYQNVNEYYAIFEKIVYSYSCTISRGNGYVDLSSPTASIDNNFTVTATAIAEVGYIFHSWSDGKTEATRTDVLTEDFSVYARFARKVTLIATEGGSILDENGNRVQTLTITLWDSYIFVEAVADEGYEVNGWSYRADAGWWNSYGSKLMIQPEFAESTYYAFFTKIEYSYTCTVSRGNGYIELSSSTASIDNNFTVTATAVAEEGYVFHSWSDGKTEATRTDILTGDFSVYARFARKITLIATEGGSILDENGNRVQTLTIALWDSNIYVQAVADEGYKVYGWSHEADASWWDSYSSTLLIQPEFAESTYYAFFYAQ